MVVMEDQQPKEIEMNEFETKSIMDKTPDELTVGDAYKIVAVETVVMAGITTIVLGGIYTIGRIMDRRAKKNEAKHAQTSAK